MKRRSVQRTACSVQRGAFELLRAARRARRVALIGVLSLSAGACSWLSDFRTQPAVGAWQSLDVNWQDTTTPFRANPQHSVPITGTAVAGYEVSYRRKSIATVDSMKSIQNPVAPTQESITRGWKYYQINCAVCHGEAGLGDGPVARFNGAPNLTNAITAAKSDGYYFGQIRNGGSLMPSFNRIPEQDRWHVINYVRGLQGRLPADITVRKEPVGLPGVTGEALPGATMSAPNRMSPFVKPVYTPTPGSGAAHSTTPQQKQHQ